MTALDRSLFFALYHLAGRSRIGDFLIVFLGEYLIYPVLLAFLAMAYRSYRRGAFAGAQPYMVAICSAVVARLGVTSLIRFWYHRPRPFLALALPHLLSDGAYSFPSGHTIFMFALAATTYFFNRKLALVLYAAGLLMGLARVAGAVHYPSDILGGAILGVAIGALVPWRLKRYGTRPV